MQQLSKEEHRKIKVSRHVFPQMKRLPIIIFLDHVNNAPNIGNIFRLADAFLLEKIILCGCVNPSLKRVKQFSRGVNRWVPCEISENPTLTISSLKAQGYSITAVELCDHSLNIISSKLKLPAVLVLGNEIAGISKEMLEICDYAVYIPMSGMGNSLNLSNVAAISAWEAVKEWQHQNLIITN